QRDRAEQYPQRAAVIAYDPVLQCEHAHAQLIAILFRVLPAQLSCDAVQFRFGLQLRNARPEPRQQAQKADGITHMPQWVSLRRERHGQFRLRIEGEEEIRRQHPDDFITDPIKQYALTQRARIRAESPAPEAVTKRYYMLIAGLIVGWQQRSAERRANAEQFKGVRRDARALHPLRLARTG